jgi:hypothetical protein
VFVLWQSVEDQLYRDRAEFSDVGIWVYADLEEFLFGDCRNNLKLIAVDNCLKLAAQSLRCVESFSKPTGRLRLECADEIRAS